MKLQQKLLMILNRERPLIDVWHYFVGNYRYYLWYGKKFKKIFIRNHIKEQIEYRIKWMDVECYNQGSCKICGCETIHLQMCNKPCDKPCYPAMMDKKEWESFKAGYNVYVDKNGIWSFNPIKKKLTIFKKTDNGYIQCNKS